MTDPIAPFSHAQGPRRRRFVLAVDGGGVRGIIAATLLDALDQARRALGATTSISDCFDLIAGVSTGAIVAAGLAAGNESGDGPRRTPSELRRLYRDRAIEIFPTSFWSRLPALGRLQQFFGPLYRSEPLDAVLADELGDAPFRRMRRNLLIAAYSIDPREAAFYRGGPDYDGHRVCDEFLCVPVRQAVAGSSAAPTVFAPKVVTNPTTGQSKTLIDGGVFINDPSVAALAEAMRLFPNDEIWLISIGTGRSVAPFPWRDARGWGFFEWLSPLGQHAMPLLQAMSDGQAQSAIIQMQKFLGPRYMRLDYDLRPALGEQTPDNASPENIRRLEHGAEQMAAKMEAELKRIAQLLASDLPANSSARAETIGDAD